MNSIIEIVAKAIKQPPLEEIVIEDCQIIQMSNHERKELSSLLNILFFGGVSITRDWENHTHIVEFPNAAPFEPQRKSVVSRIVGPKLLGESHG